MIKNFNFYDVYGYFLPGLVLLTLVWLPFGLSGRQWPAKELASALIAVPLAYVVGHLLQTIAALGLSAKSKKNDEHRYPSDLLLDKDDRAFSRDFKDRLARQIKDRFALDVEDRGNRQDAFLLCRSALIASKAAGYGEQFEGMYTLMRGLAGAFAFGSLYNSGSFLAAAYPHTEIFWFRLAVSSFALAFLFNLASYVSRLLNAKHFKTVWWTFGALAIGLVSIGAYSGSSSGSQKRGVMLVVALGSALASLRCLESFKYFASEFAKAIYRDFYNYTETMRYDEKKNDPTLKQATDSAEG